MITKEDLVFRQVVTLRDGVRVLLRPLIHDDRQGLLDLFLPVSSEERSYMRHNVNDPSVVNAWVDHIDYDTIFPLVAVVGDRVVGNATLHFYQGPARHRAEVRIYLAHDFRGRGLGTKLIQALIEQAKRRNIYIIEIQVVSELVNDIKAMQKAGFKADCILEDYFMLPDGELKDLVHMTLRLRTNDEEF
jgi:RimJ/RimL family protein N-acetyltransferase